MELIKTRTLTSYIYHGWNVLDAIHNAATNPDIHLIYKKKFIGGSLLDDDSYISIPYLHDVSGYKVRLKTVEADYFLFLKAQGGGR